MNQLKQAETLASFNNKKAEFEKLRSDVQIKLKFLDENRVKVTSLYHVSFYTRESDTQRRENTRVSAGDAEAASPFPQCGGWLLLWQPDSP